MPRAGAGAVLGQLDPPASGLRPTSFQPDNAGDSARLDRAERCIQQGSALQNHDARVLGLVVGLHVDRDQRVLDIGLSARSRRSQMSWASVTLMPPGTTRWKSMKVIGRRGACAGRAPRWRPPHCRDDLADPRKGRLRQGLVHEAADALLHQPPARPENVDGNESRKHRNRARPSR